MSNVLFDFVRSVVKSVSDSFIVSSVNQSGNCIRATIRLKEDHPPLPLLHDHLKDVGHRIVDLLRGEGLTPQLVISENDGPSSITIYVDCE